MKIGRCGPFEEETANGKVETNYHKLWRIYRNLEDGVKLDLTKIH